MDHRKETIGEISLLMHQTIIQLFILH